MLVQLKNKLVVVGVGALLASVAWGQCKTQAQPNYKDRAEYELIESIKKETDSNKKLALLNQWKEKYPATDFAAVRFQTYITTYQALGNAKSMLAASKEMVADDPCALLGLYMINVLTITRADTAPESLDTGEKGANGLLANLDNIFALTKKPEGTSEEAWKKERIPMEALAHRTLGWIALQRKQNEPAEKEFTRVLELTPADTQSSYWLGSAIAAQKNPAKQAVAIFCFARAAMFEGEGATLPATGRPQVRAYVEKIYNNFHGSKDGLDDLLNLAKTSALPPDGWKLESYVEIQEKQAVNKEAFCKANPMLCLFRDAIKTPLSADDGQKFFDEKLKDNALPELEGKLVSTKPEVRPKELVLAIDNPEGDITIKLDAALAGKMEPGAVLKFKDAVPQSFVKSPFMLVVSVEKANLTGWKGAPAPPAKKAVPKKAGARKKK